VVLTAIAGAIAGLIGAGTGPPAAGSVGIAAIVSAVVGLVILALAYFLGGYVMGVIWRGFNGPKQGLGVWLIRVALTVILAVAVVLGARFNPFWQFNLPTIPLDPGDLIAYVVILVATLLGAMAEGKAGTRYHRKVDDAGHSS
jgi:hypothetical protein